MEVRLDGAILTVLEEPCAALGVAPELVADTVRRAWTWLRPVVRRTRDFFKRCLTTADGRLTLPAKLIAEEMLAHFGLPGDMHLLVRITPAEVLHLYAVRYRTEFEESHVLLGWIKLVED